MIALLDYWPELAALMLGLSAGWMLRGWRDAARIAEARLAASTAQAATAAATRTADDAQAQAAALVARLGHMEHRLHESAAELAAARVALVNALAPGAIRAKLQADFGGGGSGEG